MLSGNNRQIAFQRCSAIGGSQKRNTATKIIVKVYLKVRPSLSLFKELSQPLQIPDAEGDRYALVFGYVCCIGASPEVTIGDDDQPDLLDILPSRRNQVSHTESRAGFFQLFAKITLQASY